jgi:hypothetical protein
MTQSGKSYYTEKNILEKLDRVLVFDFMNCFSGGEIININNESDARKIFKKFCKKSKYKIILRIKRGTNPVYACDIAISLACALGRSLGPYNPNKRVWLAIDEADRVVSSHYQSKRVKHLVNVGRHDNVDSLFIARNPSRLHTDIRANASKVISFQLPTAMEIREFRNNFGRENCKKITTLEKYNHFVWEDTGAMKIIDEKGGEVWTS